MDCNEGVWCGWGLDWFGKVDDSSLSGPSSRGNVAPAFFLSKHGIWILHEQAACNIYTPGESVNSSIMLHCSVSTNE